MKKKILSLLLALTLSLSFAVPAAAAVQFTDVYPVDYYAEAVAWAVENGITKGTTDTTFSPNETCTRAQIIAFLYRAAGSPGYSDQGIRDINVNDYFYGAVCWAKEMDLFEGVAFQPNASCTRLMAVEFMWKHAGSPGGAPKAGFTDVTSDAVDWAVENGVAKGTDATTFSPGDTCTRGQIVTFLHRASGEASETQPGDTSGRTPVTDEAEMPGIYVSEDGKYAISVELISNPPRIRFEIWMIRNDEPLLNGTLVISERDGTLVASWPGIGMYFYQECLILKTFGDAPFYLAGEYIRQ